ncbi:MAG: 3'(2'),5'-bisphosphate nucleotidase [Rhodospirillales bacterium 20-64-7]|nr:MAG: 3'(2'),5'-bisphosphate nucleotidase [Rhodospirillales bacterium 20-64-7]HQT77800.1 3'(2'),5'-bisphosphate nucleotidase CysQ [Rhodopila sp.]
MTEDSRLLELAVELAEKAGAEIRAIRARGFAVQRKADHSTVTEADHAAEAIILSGLRAALPGCVVVAEEEVAAGVVTQAVPVFWLVDPLDGTREFTGGGDDFAVNIGLVRDGRPVLGVVGVPATGAIYGGIVGVGAWRQKDGTRTAITTRQPPAEGITVVASRHHGDPQQLDAFLAGRRVAQLVNFGSSLKFCRVAEGQADLYPRFGRTMEWDTCSPQAVLEAAGGAVTTMDGQMLRYGKPGWDNPHFVCWGTPPGPTDP